MPALSCASGAPVCLPQGTTVDGQVYVTDCSLSCVADELYYKQSAGHQTGLPADTIMCPPFGTKSECGLRYAMEDALAVCPDFCTASVPVGPPSQTDTWPSDVQGRTLTSQPAVASLLGGRVNQTLHYFGVYDGHAGAEASQHCSKRLHSHLRKALQTPKQGDMGIQSRNEEDLCSTISSLSDSTGFKPHHSDECCCGGRRECSTGDSTQSGTSASEAARSGIIGSWANTRKQAMSAAAHSARNIQSRQSYGSTNTSSSQQQDEHVVEAALHRAFLATDAELSKSAAFSLSGSTAVVAVVGQTHLWVANAGGLVLPAQQMQPFAAGP
jgi:serine/threonine protein phosphatase PrpC